MTVSSNRVPEEARRREVIRAGDAFAATVEEGEVLSIVDLHGNQAADTLFYRADDPRERYSAADTVRAQRGVYLTTGSTLMSTAGRSMLTIVADTCGRHDTLGGGGIGMQVCRDVDALDEAF